MLYLPPVDTSQRVGKRAYDPSWEYDWEGRNRDHVRRVAQVEADVKREAAQRGAVLTAVEVRAAVKQRLDRGYY